MAHTGINTLGVKYSYLSRKYDTIKKSPPCYAVWTLHPKFEKKYIIMTAYAVGKQNKVNSLKTNFRVALTSRCRKC